MKINNLKKAFTLIEILTVISIIGILSAILFASFGEAREDAKNKVVKTGMKEVQLALELYKAQNGSYPADGNTAFKAALEPEFIADVPDSSDSGNSNCTVNYVSDDGGGNNWYKLTAERCHSGAADVSEGVQSDDKFARCPSTCSSGADECAGEEFDDDYIESADFYESYAIYSLGGECE